MSYGDKNWRPWVLNEEEARPFFALALERGITFFDTSNMYSLGVSEEITGRLLREMARLDEIVIATKVFYPMRGEAPNMRGLSRKHIVQACEASLKRLGIDTIDLYQIHRWDGTTPIEETLAALDHLVRQGKVRYIGASSGYAWQLARALYLSDKNMWARFVSMQDHYNLLYREEEREVIPLCRAEGLGILPWSPLARGVLARGSRPAAGEEPTARAEYDQFTRTLYDQTSDDDVLATVRTVAKTRGVSNAEVALAWLLSKSYVTAPIIGATKMSHLETAIRALDVVLSADEIQMLEAPYRPHPIKGH
jgi:aryl-alcohol dehydrogenase-like predicted oxidoreductase